MTRVEKGQKRAHNNIDVKRKSPETRCAGRKNRLTNQSSLINNGRGFARTVGQGEAMDKTVKKDLRYQPLYSLAEVSRYARVQASTLKSWTRSEGSGLLVPAGQGIAPLSFINLIESHVLRALRRTHQVPMQKIRKAVDWLKAYYQTEHPLAERNLETDGYDIFVREADIPVSASRGGQGGIPEILCRYLERIERDPKYIPIRFFPIPYETSPKSVMMDPGIAYGRPVIKGTRITTVMVFDRYSGGESLADIADDYGLNMPLVEEALRCEIEQRAA